MIGSRVNGARRWFHFGPLSFQPAELIEGRAHRLFGAHPGEESHWFTFSLGLPPLVVCGIFCWPAVEAAQTWHRDDRRRHHHHDAVRRRYARKLPGGSGPVCAADCLITLSSERHGGCDGSWRFSIRQFSRYWLSDGCVADCRRIGRTHGPRTPATAVSFVVFPEAHTDYILAIIGEVWFLGVGFGIAEMYASWCQ